MVLQRQEIKVWVLTGGHIAMLDRVRWAEMDIILLVLTNWNWGMILFRCSKSISIFKWRRREIRRLPLILWKLLSTGGSRMSQLPIWRMIKVIGLCFRRISLESAAEQPLLTTRVTFKCLSRSPYLGAILIMRMLCSFSMIFHMASCQTCK